MLRRSRRYLWALPACIAVAVALWWSDPAAAHVADLRIYLLDALAPLAERFGLTWPWLPLLFYPLVAINIIAPVIIIGILRHRKSLRLQLSGQHQLPPPWPRISERHGRGGCEYITLQIRNFPSVAQLYLILVTMVGLFSVALYGRDVLRQLLAAEEGLIAYLSILEILLIILAARLVYWWARSMVLAKLAHIEDATYDGDGWLLFAQSTEPNADRLLQAKRVVRDKTAEKDWPERLAAGIAAIWER